MAKIDTLEFEIDGVKYTSNVNVLKNGVFRVTLNWQVAEVLNLKNSTLESSTKDGVVTPIMDAYREFLNSKREYSLWLSIVYKATRNFSKYANGEVLFCFTDRKFYESGFSSEDSKLIFGFSVYCKEINSTSKNPIWYSTEKITKSNPKHDMDREVDGFAVKSITYSVGGDKGTLIPYSEQAFNTLAKAEEGIRGISEVLFTFLNQDPALIEGALLGGNLLQAKKEIDE